MSGAEDKDGKDEQLKEAFTEYDLNGDGMLSFDEFMHLLCKGDPKFPEEEAYQLFKAADIDASGALNFKEFVDYIYDNQDFAEFVDYQIKHAHEEVAKKIILGKSLMVRTAATARLKKAGKDWRKLTWEERVIAVQELEDSGFEEPPEPVKEEAAVVKATPFEGMGQGELVDYSIHRYDLSFVGTDRSALEQVNKFRDHLRTVSGPSGVVDVKRYIAKGTAGWVFEVEWKDSGKKAAMKMIRMTQALSGIKEWYVSRVLRKAGIKNVVFTAEQVCVQEKTTADPVIMEQIKDAGPVPYYVCMMQDFMGGGSLEDLCDAGKLGSKMMFQALEDVSSTLAQMHVLKIYHKDVKPENVLVEMEKGELVAAKLCDFGSAEMGDHKEAQADDVRRFGVTLFSLATGEAWAKKRLIHAEHTYLVNFLKDAVKDSEDPAMKKLPAVLTRILKGMPMEKVVEIMKELKDEAL